jgi:hypothetical protein
MPTYRVELTVTRTEFYHDVTLEAATAEDAYKAAEAMRCAGTLQLKDAFIDTGGLNYDVSELDAAGEIVEIECFQP